MLSCLSMLLCVSMLVGSTFAWFTDTASTGVNTIKAGNLDVKLSYKNAVQTTYQEVDKTTNVFKTGTLWEPGHVEYVHLKIENVGSLAFKYQLAINIANETKGINMAGNEFILSEYIKYAVLDGERTFNTSAEAAAAAETAGGKKLYMNEYTNKGTMEEGADAKIVTLVVYMPTDVGNVANYKTGTTPPQIDLGINLVATQVEAENDSFGNEYDKPAPMPNLPTRFDVTLSASVVANQAVNLTSNDGKISANIPADAIKNNNDDNDENNVTKVELKVNTTASDNTSVTYEINFVDQNGAELEFAKPVTVPMEIGKNLQKVAVTHNGTEPFTSVNSEAALVDGTFYYDANTGILTICSDNFSPYEISFEPADYVLSVGTQGYHSLKEAVDAAKDGDTIKLMDNLELTEMVVIAADKNITLDLNGKAITVTKSGDRSLYALDNKGTLTLTDSVGTGSITARGNYNYGTLVMNGGTIVACDTNGGYGVWNYGSFTMNGGTIQVTHVGSYGDQYGPTGLGNEASATAVITGGTFKGVSARAYIIASEGTLEISPAEGKEVKLTAYRGIAINDGTAVINGGTFQVLDANEEEGQYVAFETYYALYIGGGEGVTVNGGNFLAPDQSVWNASNATPVVIKGGYFNTSMTGVGDHINKNITIYGGVFAVNPDSAYIANGSASYANANGSFTVARLISIIGSGTLSYDKETKTFTIVHTGSTVDYVGATIDLTEGYDANASKVSGTAWEDAPWLIESERSTSFIQNINGREIYQLWIRPGTTVTYYFDMNGDGATDFTVVFDATGATKTTA